MKFVLMFQQPAQVYQSEADSAKGPAMFQAWMTYMGEMEAQGIICGGNRLDPMSISTVRVREGKLRVDGRATSTTSDLLGGYVVIDVSSMDEAVKWAARSPSSLTGNTAVYSVMEEPS